jgi:hypothetical protein
VIVRRHLSSYVLGQSQRIFLGKSHDRKRLQDTAQVTHPDSFLDQPAQDIRQQYQGDWFGHDASHRGGRKLLELVEQALNFREAEKIGSALAHQGQDLDSDPSDSLRVGQFRRDEQILGWNFV